MAYKPPEQSTMSAVHVADAGPGQLTKTPTARLSCKGMGMKPIEKKVAEATAPSPPPPPPPVAPSPVAPSPDIGSQEIYSVATATDVGCPRCQDRFKISPEFFEAVAECPKCQCEFVIKPPVAPPDQSVDSGKTNTSKLDRPVPSESKLKSPASAEGRPLSAPRPPGVTGVPAPPAVPATPPEPDASPEPDAALETAVKSDGKGRNKTVVIVAVVVVLVIAVGGYFVARKMFM